MNNLVDFRNHIERMLKPYRDIQKITEPIIQLQKDLNKALEPLIEIQKSFNRINQIYASIPKFENPILEHLNAFKKIGEFLKKYAENTPKNLLLIAQYGWFIEFDCEINLPSQVSSEILDDNIENANVILTEYYSSNIDRIFSELIDRHPVRKEIFTQILFAYKNNSHYILIPSVLTQVDGICFDFTRKKFFIKEKNNNYLPQITSELEKSADSFLLLYLSPLQNQTPIMAREEDIHKFPCHLNRHEILHGISSDYGTKINSLKVISLLKYISDLLLRIDEKQ
jgi:hypothetical protein